MNTNLLTIKDLHLSFNSANAYVHALRGVNLSVKKGECLAIVGESACGKSVLCKSILKLLPRFANIDSGNIIFDCCDITHYSDKDMCKLRKSAIAYVPQDPMNALNPSLSVYSQLSESILLANPNITKIELRKRCIQLMEQLGIDRAELRLNSSPSQLSGGMRQRLVLAMALAKKPLLLIADEPTTALDASIRHKSLKLIQSFKDSFNMSVIIISHDISSVLSIADKMAVMYAGKIIEYGKALDCVKRPAHPYTRALLLALPIFAQHGQDLNSIEGFPPSLARTIKGDAFAPRNKYALNIDFEEEPPFFKAEENHYAASWLLDKRASKIRKELYEQKLYPFGD